MKYYIIAGETSGDQHAATLISALKAKDKDAQFRGMGGDDCLAAGMHLVLHQKEMAIMGFWEVIQNLNKILKVLKLVKADLLKFRPDHLILIDYPGFNLKLAQFAKKHGFKVNYYIAPKVWAWKEKRVYKIKAYVDRLFCILPFEQHYFQQFGIEALYIGNPSYHKVKQFNQLHNPEPKKRIALIPGSRKQEITTALPIMLSLKSAYPDYEFAVAQAPGFDEYFYRQIDKDLVLEKNMYKLLANSECAIVTSGTATLETALLEVPQVVCYKTSKLTYAIAKRFIKVKYISLVNLILERKAIEELIQDDFNPSRLQSEVNDLLLSGLKHNHLKKDYSELKAIIGDLNPSEVLANVLLE